MKKYDYNIVIIDCSEASCVLDIIKKRGEDGERFVGWIPGRAFSNPDLQRAIFEKEINE